MTMLLVGGGFVAWVAVRCWKIVEIAQRTREPKLKGILYGEAIFHVAVIVMIYALLWSLSRS